MLRPLFEILLYAVGVWHGYRLARSDFFRHMDEALGIDGASDGD